MNHQIHIDRREKGIYQGLREELLFDMTVIWFGTSVIVQ